MENLNTNKIIIILMFLMYGTSMTAQTIEWVHPYVSCASHGSDVIFDNQAGLYFCGQARPSTYVFDSLSVPSYGYEDSFFCKIDSTSGEIQWLHTFGTAAQDDTYELSIESDHVFVLGGAGSVNYSFYMDGISYPLLGSFLAKYDTSGSLVWVIARSINDFANDHLGNTFISSYNSLFKLNSNGVATDSLFLFNPNGSFFKNKIIVDPQGNVIFNQTFKDSINFLGIPYFSPPGCTDYLLLKCDSNLNVLSIKQVSGNQYDYVNDMIINNDGLVTTVSTCSDTMYYDGLMMVGSENRLVLSNLDSNLDIITQFELNMQSPANARLRQNDLDEFYLGLNYNYSFGLDYYVINGDTLETNSSCQSCEMGVIAKLGTTGQVLWYREIAQDPSATYTSGSATLIMSEPVGNKIFIAGKISPFVIIDTTTYFTSGNGGAYTALLIDTTYGLNLGLPGINSLNQMMQVYPNPGTGEFQIDFQELISNGQIEIYNAMGAKVYFEFIENAKAKSISLATNKRGIYFVTVIADNQYFNQKIILH